MIAVNTSKVKNLQEADGFITNKAGFLLLIFTADCLPVIIYEKNGKAVGITHCGWKSTYKGIAIRAIKKMIRNYKLEIRNLRVVFGPSIHPCCYEVSKDLIDKFERKFGKVGTVVRKGKYYLDLEKINTEQLKRMGIKGRNISKNKYCTHCETKKYYSYRRDGKGTGRMVTGVMIDSGM